MPAGLEDSDTMFSVREVPWHGLGFVPDRHPDSIREALEWSGLDWDVVQEPVFIQTGQAGFSNSESYEPIPNHFANVRSDTGKTLGIVTSRYSPVQNIEAFEFLGNLMGTEFLFETAGSLQGGRRAWVMMKLPEYVEVGGDDVGQYVFVSNSHDGKSSVLAAMTPIRIVCQNTLGAAVGRAKGGKRTYTIRHLGDMSTKIAEARNVMEVTINYYEQFASLGNKLALQTVGERRAAVVLDKLFPITPELGDRAAANREEAREAVMSIFNGEGGGGDTRGNSPGSFWCLYNAATEYSDWYRPERKEGGRFQRSIDDPDSFKSTALSLIREEAGV